MHVSLPFPAEVEHAIRQRALQAGEGIESFLQRMVTETLAVDEPAPAPRARSHAEFMAKLREIGARHPGSNGRMDDSRESIYAGCGE